MVDVLTAAIWNGKELTKDFCWEVLRIQLSLEIQIYTGADQFVYEAFFPVGLYRREMEAEEEDSGTSKLEIGREGGVKGLGAKKIDSHKYNSNHYFLITITDFLAF